MKFDVVGRRAVHGANSKKITFSQPEVTEFGPAKAYGILKDNPEYRGKVTSR